MKESTEHIEKEFFKKTEIKYSASKEEVWESISQKIDIEIKPKSNLRIKYYRLAAAVMILLIGSGIFLRFYTKEVLSLRGQHISHVLPDGSEVLLNAESSINYNPYWWIFNRELNFKGEAFFQVEKGEKFTVISENGKTEVLGTSFNIFARNNDYKVFCNTGKVKVSSIKDDVNLIINPGESAIIINKEGQIKENNSEEILSWKEYKFSFQSEEIINVLIEIERQYNVSINHNIANPSEYIYTGFFNKKDNPEEILDLICQTFDLKFVKQGEGKYKVFQN